MRFGGFAFTVVLAGTVALLIPSQVTYQKAVSADTSSRTTSRPNVVLIVTDDQRAGTEVGMPTVMSELAAKGASYPHAFVSTPLCCPSRASLMTGKFSHNTGVWLNGQGTAWGGWLAFQRGGEETDTLATRLKNAGYRTGLFGKYLNGLTLAKADYVPPGWDRWNAYLSGGYSRYRLSSDKTRVTGDRRYLTDELAARAVRFIRSTPKNQPVFTYFAPYAPHLPFDAGPYKGRAQPWLDDVKEATQFPSAATNQEDMSGYPAWMQTLDRSEYWRTSSLLLSDVVERQADMLFGVDVAIQRILTALRESGRLENTLIVFTSDNGYSWGEHRVQGKATPHDASVRVPLVMRFDGRLPAGTVDPRVVGANVDVYASILDFAGVTPGRVDGRSVRTSPARTGLVLEEALYRGRPAYCGYRTPDHLFVRYATGEEELYDYVTDPHELTNLAGDPAHEDVRSELERKAREACSPTPPGFTWGDGPTKLNAPSNVVARWSGPRKLQVTWRAPANVGSTYPSYAVHLGKKAKGKAACKLPSTGLKRGLTCTIRVAKRDQRPWVTVASTRDGTVVAAKPVRPSQRQPR